MNKPTITQPTILSEAEARALLERFESGDTSLADEQALYLFFRSADLPPDLAPLRPLMAWYEGGCSGEPQMSPSVAPSSSEPTRIRRFAALRPILMSAASVALVVALAFSIRSLSGSSQIAGEPEHDNFAELYGGSYIIRNGEKITDPALIRNEIMRAGRLTDSINNVIAMRTNPDNLLASAVEKRIGSSHPRAVETIISTLQNNR
jgi:hypothetical protein